MALTDDVQAIAARNAATVVRELGCGGMGCVYLVRDDRSGGEYALKVILPALALNADARQLFEREIANALALQHDNVVRTRSAGEVDGALYLMMDYCDGGSVDRVVERDGPLPVERALDITMQVLAGLEYAHNAPLTGVKLGNGSLKDAVGVVHRDLKPQNILLAGGPGGSATAKVADLGLAKAFEVAGLSGVTTTNAIAGTPAFMPRQQVLNFKYAGPEVDVWAAAATLYFLLTASTPRDFSRADPWLTVVETSPVPIAGRGRSVPARLAEVIDEALLDSPRLRYGSAAGLRDALASAR